MENIKKISAKFIELFGEEPEGVFFAPGRVNLIGEHTDYNGGHVFPCALTMGTYGAAKRRTDDKIRFYSMNFEDSVVIETTVQECEPKNSGSDGWTAYPKGVVWAFAQKGHKIKNGFDLVVYGNIPSGSGLSSSASLEVLTGTVIKELFGFETVTMTGIALLGQMAENKYCGMNCGIMDQFASAMGKKDNAIFLDCATLNYEYAPMVLDDAKIVIVNSRVKHSLVGSEYNLRRQYCEEALSDLQKVLDIKNLGDLTNEQFDENSAVIRDEVHLKRARHAVYENQRTIKAVAALKNNDINEFGRLMNETHVSLRDDYETSCRECDIIAETAWRCDGVIGARITGGGFGGCVVCIVKNDAIDGFISSITGEYKDKTGIDCEVYVAACGEGAGKLK